MADLNNFLLNSQFKIWPEGETFTSSVSPRTAACWLWEEGIGNTVTISKSTSSTSSTYIKWLRNQPCMNINCSTLGDSSSLRVYQRVNTPQYELGRNLIRVTLIVSGPNGESFYYGVEDERAKVTTLGDLSGVPRLVTVTNTFAIGDLPNTYIDFTIFENPSNTGLFTVHFAQASIGQLQKWDRLTQTTEAEDWARMRPYLTPILKGSTGIGISTTQVRVPVEAIPGGWVSAPFIPTGSKVSSIELVNAQTGTTLSTSAATYTLGSVPTADEYGCSVVIGGLTGVAAGATYIIGDTLVPVCVLEHGY